MLDFQRKLSSFLKQPQNFDLFRHMKTLKKSGFEKMATIWIQIATNFDGSFMRIWDEAYDNNRLICKNCATITSM